MNRSMSFVVLVAILATMAQADLSNTGPTPWLDANATFHGDIRGGEAIQGACGYGDLFKYGYDLETAAALSITLFHKGERCGACYELVCANSQWCKPKARPIRITATNFCPPNYAPSVQNYRCNPPNTHFDISEKLFLQIAENKGGVVPVKYRRVLCHKRGGVRFEIKKSNGNPNLMVLVYNIDGAGDVENVVIKGDKSKWVRMQRNRGQIWETNVNLVGQSLSFVVQTSNGMSLTFKDIVPQTWRVGKTFEAESNF